MFFKTFCPSIALAIWLTVSGLGCSATYDQIPVVYPLEAEDECKYFGDEGLPFRSCSQVEVKSGLMPEAAVEAARQISRGNHLEQISALGYQYCKNTLVAVAGHEDASSAMGVACARRSYVFDTISCRTRHAMLRDGNHRIVAVVAMTASHEQQLEDKIKGRTRKLFDQRLIEGRQMLDKFHDQLWKESVGFKKSAKDHEGQ